MEHVPLSLTTAVEKADNSRDIRNTFTGILASYSRVDNNPPQSYRHSPQPKKSGAHSQPPPQYSHRHRQQSSSKTKPKKLKPPPPAPTSSSTPSTKQSQLIESIVETPAEREDRRAITARLVHSAMRNGQMPVTPHSGISSRPSSPSRDSMGVTHTRESAWAFAFEQLSSSRPASPTTTTTTAVTTTTAKVERPPSSPAEYKSERRHHERLEHQIRMDRGLDGSSTARSLLSKRDPQQASSRSSIAQVSYRRYNNYVPSNPLLVAKGRGELQQKFSAPGSVTRREKRIEALERKIATFEADAVSERKRLLEEFNAKKDEEFRELEKQIREFDTKADVERRRLFEKFNADKDREKSELMYEYERLRVRGNGAAPAPAPAPAPLLPTELAGPSAEPVAVV